MKMDSILEEIRDIIHEKGYYVSDEIVSLINISENIKNVDTMISHINSQIENGFISSQKIRDYLKIVQELYIQTLDENFMNCSEELYSYLFCMRNKPILRMK